MDLHDVDTPFTVIGAAFDLFVDEFQRVSGPNLPPMPVRESGEGEDITPSVLEHQGDLRVGAGQHPGGFIDLDQDVLLVGLGEDRANNRGPHILRTLRDDG